MSLSLKSDVAENKIYNCSGTQGVTFLGLLSIASLSCGFNPSDIKYTFFDSSKIDSKARKLFPLRLEHFFTDISLLQHELNWQPSFDLQQGFNDSYKRDYLLKKTNSPDFTSDLKLIGV